MKALNNAGTVDPLGPLWSADDEVAPPNAVDGAIGEI